MILGNPGKRVVRDPPKGVATDMLRTTASQYIHLNQYMYLFIFLTLYGSLENRNYFYLLPIGPSYVFNYLLLLKVILIYFQNIIFMLMTLC